MIPLARRLSYFDTTRVLKNSIQQSTYELQSLSEKGIEHFVTCSCYLIKLSQNGCHVCTIKKSKTA